MRAHRAYRPPESEWTTQTYSAPRDRARGDDTSHLPGESPRSDRSRAAPKPDESTDENRQRSTPTPSFNVPGPASGEGNQKIPCRSPGTPGEQYGHPYKFEVYDRRTASPSRVVAMFFRETLRPGHDYDPGDGAQDLGLPSLGEYPRVDRRPYEGLGPQGPDEPHMPGTAQAPNPYGR